MLKKKSSFPIVGAAVGLLLLTAGCATQKTETAATKPQDQPGASADARPPRNPLRNAYFGEMHLHSGFSMDANALGTKTTPEDANRYAMGEPVEYFGKPRKRIAPLDFLALTDHAEYLGVAPEIVDPNGPFAKTDWYKMMSSTDQAVTAQAFRKIVGSFADNKPLPEFSDPKALRSAWEKYMAVAEKYNKPGKFTSFVGFEWTSAPKYQNLHRCVIFEQRS